MRRPPISETQQTVTRAVFLLCENHYREHHEGLSVKDAFQIEAQLLTQLTRA